MPGVLTDKYFFISVSLMLVLVLVWSALNVDVKQENEDQITCIVFDIRETGNGFVFMIETSDGLKYKCFYFDRPIEFGLYGISGNFSDNKSILFVDKMVLMEHQ
ncbi:MAG: hypothetical protein PWR17_360 [Candidatus Methanomethylophilaceae archaeon]|nr:hypothetical protein [Candidatus Methanomethylophilaceae archaeon]